MGLPPEIRSVACAPRCANVAGAVAGNPTSHKAFTLIDILASLAVIVLLMALLAPSLAMVREATRRVVCSSNMKQIAYGVVMYADDHKDSLPYSKYSSLGAPQYMIMARIDDFGPKWDGIGTLFDQGYLPTPGVFYCPSHHGDNPFSRYAEAWGGVDPIAIATNYHYRGSGQQGPNLMSYLATKFPNMCLLADGLASQQDYNHRVGCNVMHLDTSVSWFNDEGGVLQASLAQSPDDPGAISRVRSAWNMLDQAQGLETPAGPQ